ncbi:hypothetical protein ACFFX0_11370 [Citricoccus parietis]|uniref:Uncharacterized protein n=1 Tax=Citricoccus parietis TaxID=592307 RepID=A0ABV5FYM1_9MICC
MGVDGHALHATPPRHPAGPDAGPPATGRTAPWPRRSGAGGPP